MNQNPITNLIKSSGCIPSGYNKLMKPWIIKDSVVQYLHTLIKTCDNIDDDDDDAFQTWNEKMLSLQIYLFGEHPDDKYNEEIYIDSFYIPDIIKDEFIEIQKCLNDLYYGYSCVEIAKIMSKVYENKGAVGRATLGIKSFRRYEPHSKWYSVVDILNDNLEYDDLYFIPSAYQELWGSLDKTITEDNNRMREMSRQTNVCLSPTNIIYHPYYEHIKKDLIGSFEYRWLNY